MDINTLSLASALAAHAAARQQVLAENVAHADTPGYRRKTVSFEEAYARPGEPVTVTTSPVMLDQSELNQVFDPTNPLANDQGYYTSSNVDLIIEIADAREANRSYEANLRMFDQARQMASSLLGLLRK